MVKRQALVLRPIKLAPRSSPALPRGARATFFLTVLAGMVGVVVLRAVGI